MALVNPPELFGKYIYIFERIQPLSIALGACWLSSGFSSFMPAAAPSQVGNPRILPASADFYSGSDRLGISWLPPNLGYGQLKMSSVPGIPLFVPQLYFLLLLVGLWIALYLHRRQISLC